MKNIKESEIYLTDWPTSEVGRWEGRVKNGIFYRRLQDGKFWSALNLRFFKEEKTKEPLDTKSP